MFIEQLSDLFRRYVAQHKRDHADLLASCPDDPQPIDHRQSLGAIMQQRMFILPDIVNPDLIHVIQRRAEPYCVGNIRGASFELCGRITVDKMEGPVVTRNVG